MVLQCEMITPEQFLLAFDQWNTNRTQSLKQLLLDQNPLLREMQNLLEDYLPNDPPGGKAIQKTLSCLCGQQ